MYELQQISIRKTQADQAIENEPEHDSESKHLYWEHLSL